MATTVTFNGFSFQDVDILTPDIDRYSMPERQVQSFDLSFSDRQKVVTSFFKKKVITISGNFLASTESALQTMISQARAALVGEEATLAIPFNGLTINYTATVTKNTIPRTNVNVSFCPYTVEFTCVNPPFGVDSVLNTDTNAAITTTPKTSTFLTGGEYAPEPTLTFTVNSETTLTTIVYTQDDTGYSITVSTAFTAGDVLVINMANKSVLLNGSPQDYSGNFPSFVVGTNNYTIDFTSAAHNVDLVTTWQDFYL